MTKNDLIQLQGDLIELKKIIPSFNTICMSEEFKEKNGVEFAYVITEGEYKDVTVVIRSLQMEDENISIDWSAMDKDDNTLTDEKIGKITGSIVNMILIEKVLKDAV